jgi:hypothetical protein
LDASHQESSGWVQGVRARPDFLRWVRERTCACASKQWRSSRGINWPGQGRTCVRM